jgi:hypothetical protein
MHEYSDSLVTWASEAEPLCFGGHTPVGLGNRQAIIVELEKALVEDFWDPRGERRHAQRVAGRMSRKRAHSAK